MSFPSSPTQVLRPSSEPSPEKAPKICARHCKSALRSADDCISQMKTPGPGKGGDQRRVSQPGPDSASRLRLGDAPQLGQPASPLTGPAPNVETMCPFSLQLPNPSAFSALENPVAHQRQKWVAERVLACFKLFIPPLLMD